MKKYYFAGATRVAVRTGSSNPLWLLGDHLGSTSKVVNYNGLTEQSQQLYKPWGTDRYIYGTTPTTYKFTGQRQESGIGLYFYNARWYDASAGRFLNGDSIVPNNGQGNDDSKRIQILLVVDYHESNLLAQLSETYKDYLHKISDDPQSARKADRLNPIQNDDREQDSMEVDNLNNVYQPLVDFNQQSNLGRQQNNVSQDEDGKNKANNLVDLMPTRLNSMVFDRYAYTSNCPTKYTDPSGHCDMAKAIGSGVITLLGGGIVGLGLTFIGVGVIEVSVASPTIVGIFIGLHEIGVGGLTATTGYLIIRKGVEGIINSDCLQGLDSDNTNP